MGMWQHLVQCQESAIKVEGKSDDLTQSGNLENLEVWGTLQLK
jgi:hypothetical protein